MIIILPAVIFEFEKNDRTMKTNIFLTLIFIAAVFYSGCKDKVTEIEIPDSNISFRAHLQPVFERKCNINGCHEDASRAGGLSLTSYINVTSDLYIVTPYEPANSRLFQVLNPNDVKSMPPPPYPVLTEKEHNAVGTWIKEGAKNN